MAAYFFGIKMFDSEACEFLTVTDLLKARPSEEGGERMVYFEASNEALDQQGEVVLAKALADSADYYLRYGNLDIDHITQIGARAGIPDYNLFEIGRPVEVRVDGSKTFAKCQIYRGEGPVAEKANQVWDSLTKIDPPARWYPSVGGSIQERGTEFDPLTKSTRSVVRRVRWTNIGLSRTPVNQTVPTIATMPFGVLAKCWGVGGLDMTKALEAGYGTDVATLSGAGALRKQSLDRKVQSYWDFRDRLAGDMKANNAINNPKSMFEHAVGQYGCGEHEAAEWTEKFMDDLKSGYKRRMH